MKTTTFVFAVAPICLAIGGGMMAADVHNSCIAALDQANETMIGFRLELEDWQTNYWMIRKEP